MAQSSNIAFTPTYNLTWRKLLNSWDKMAQDETLPTVIDRSYLRWLPGSAQTSYIALARQVGLIDEQNAPTDLLRQLVYEPDTRPELVGRLLHQHYAPIIELGKQHSTAQQLMDLWKETYGQDGDTRRKAITFFMQAADFAGIQLSPQWERHVASATRQASKASNTRRSSTRIPKQRAAHEPAAITPSHTIHFADDAGTLSISVDVDLLKLSKEDRDFVIGIVDAIREHQAGRSDTDEPIDAVQAFGTDESG